MRPHGNANISARAPSALGICQRCGFMYNLASLRWQYDWQFGPRLRNLNIQVCIGCLDVPQESGRTVVLPPDPVAVAFPLPEDYAAADNPASALGYNPANNFLPPPPRGLSGNQGNMSLNAGVDAAFNGVTNKRAQYCAALAVSNSSFQNTVIKNWNPNPSGIGLTIASTVAQLAHVLSTFSIYGPNDRKILNSATGVTGYHVVGSSNGTTFTTLVSGNTAGTVGEIITGTSTFATSYPYHAAVIQGDGISAVALAQFVVNISDASPNDI